MIPQFIAGLISFGIAIALMPWVMATAREYRILDYPDGDRRIHRQPIPRLGGIAIFIATSIAATLVFFWDSLDSSFQIPPSTIMPGVILGSVIVFATGVVDDLRNVSPKFKLVAQTTAALIVVAYGFRIDSISLSGEASHALGILSVPITVLWIVGMTNAFNLIDGVDGLAASFALIGFTVAIGVDLVLHGARALVITASTLGAVFAFLHFHRSPARIFLGDSGSMTLGFFLSIRLVTAATTTEHVTYAIIPIFALAYPITDTMIAIARRWLRGHPFSRADGRHIHHQVLALGLSARRTVDLLGLVFCAIAIMGVSIALAPPSVTIALGSLVLLALFVTFFYAVRWLRYTEFIEFGHSVASVLLNARNHVKNKILTGDIVSALGRAKSLEDLANILNESAADLGLLDVSLVVGNSHYTAPAARQISPLDNRPFRVDYPIAWEQDGQVFEAVLRLWCERPGPRQHFGTERIASRLAPAVEGWLKTNGTPAYSQPAIPSRGVKIG